jgi:virginiamycin A acetyltransferase
MKEFSKFFLRACFRGCSLPAAMFYFANRTIVGSRVAFAGVTQLYSLIPGVLGQYAREGLLYWILPQMGKNCCISFGAVFSHPTVALGNHCYIGVFCVVGDADIGDDVLIGSCVSIINGNRQHGIDRLDIPVREQIGTYPRINIGDDAWIGDRSLIMADVGKHAVVGAGSVVTKPVQDNAIVVGNPARVIGYRTSCGVAKGSQQATEASIAELTTAKPLNPHETIS